MKYGSVCSGVEAASVAWQSLGWTPTWFAEIEKFPSQVLAHHYPDIPNLGDMKKIAEMVRSEKIEAPDVLVGGTPCQAFSVAGLRNSLEDDRGQLSLEFVRLANEIDSARLIQGFKPSIIVWENVPGVLSTKDNAFGCFLGALSGEGSELQPTGKKWTNAGCVFGPQRQIAWRVLDAQYFGLAQRRKRVFVVASARTECIAEVLFERKSVLGDFKTSKSKGEDFTRSGGNYIGATGQTLSGKRITPPPLASHGEKMWLGNQEAFSGDYYIGHAIGVGGCNSNAAVTEEKSATLLSNNDRGYVIHSCGIQRNIIGLSSEQAPTLTMSDRHGVVIHGTQDPILSSKYAHCLGRNSGQENVYISYLARYLTEIECERLQGFPDNYTNIPGASKVARYKAMGNSMAVPVMHWIGQRIEKVQGAAA
ncbi:DNA cytosine methyltransferase [Acinetobacter larvae]|uniref:Cytosine-specific methyltransferase n=1 Tax=Acinetobacter larvae TaxID=1789224 RepID=A0A1B2LZA2_9GAMM|nr:DNA cytosine methyltransferase [Acinetobacter larvae]AOA58257.1 DNA (cytosine-5-)-methyltransferase [Acinetobacter larvae]